MTRRPTSTITVTDMSMTCHCIDISPERVDRVDTSHDALAQSMQF
jgi:hypothetical protein